MTAWAYAASGQEVDSRLDIAPDGIASMYLGSSWSLPPAGDLDTVGWFTDRISAGALARLTEVTAAAGLESHPASEETPISGSVVRTLVVTDGDKTHSLFIPGEADPSVAPIEEELQKLMVAMTAHPRAALRLRVVLRRAQRVVEGTVTFEAVGTAPLRIGLDSPIDIAVTVVGESGEVYEHKMLDPPDLGTGDDCLVAPGDTIEVAIPSFNLSDDPDAGVRVGAELTLKAESGEARHVVLAPP